MTGVLEVTEYTDPGCVWSWGSEPALRWLRLRYGNRVRWRRVYGVKLDGRAAPSADDLVAEWAVVARATGAPVTGWLRWTYRSTRLACLAAKAGESQGQAVGDRTLRRLREAFFVYGTPPDTADRLKGAVRGVEGLDVERLLDDLASSAVAAAIDHDADEARLPRMELLTAASQDGAPRPALVRDGSRARYAFPTLVLRGAAGERAVSGWQPVGLYRDAAEAVAPGVAPRSAGRLSPHAALDRLRSLAGPELDLLTGQPTPPSDAVALATPSGPLWRHPDDARALIQPGAELATR